MRHVAVTILLIAGVITGCGGSASSSVHHTEMPTATPNSGPELTGTLNLSGGRSVHATFHVRAKAVANGDVTAAPPHSTCADYARGLNGAPGAFAAPVVETGGKESTYIQVLVPSDYSGPGTYTAAQDHIQGFVSAGTGTEPGQTASYTIYRSSVDGDTVMTVNADGSGAVHLSHWSSLEIRGAGSTIRVNVFGDLTWTCS